MTVPTDKRYKPSTSKLMCTKSNASLISNLRKVFLESTCAAAVLAGFTCNSMAATTLSGLTEFATDSQGSFFNSSVWNTRGGDSTANLFVVGGSDPNGPFINGPSDSQTSILIGLSPGIHTYSILGGGGGFTASHGLNLFFDGNNAVPGISVYGPTQTSANPPYPIFGPNGGSYTMTLDSNPVPGANSLAYNDGSSLITLTDYRWAAPSVYNLDRINAPFANPGSVGTDGSADWVGQFTINVVAVPEPSSVALFILAGALGFVAVRKSRILVNRG
jgi:hypothetical protein